jgi:hypothetical protein
MYDILDKAFHLPLRRPLADLATFRLVPEHASTDRGRASWVAIADRRAAPASKRAAELIHSAIRESGMTLDTYLGDQLARLRASHTAVAPVRLYLRGPGSKLGSFTRAWMGVPRAGMREEEVNTHLQALLAEMSARAELAGHLIRGKPCRKPDRPARQQPPVRYGRKQSTGRTPQKGTMHQGAVAPRDRQTGTQNG